MSNTQTDTQTPDSHDYSVVPNKPHARKVHMIPLAAIVQDTRTWPRQDVDAERVKLFTELYANDGDVVPPIELFPVRYKGQDKTSYVLVDGWHRFTARQKMHAANAPAIVRDDIASLDDAYLEACRSSATSSKPLTSKEKRAAVRHILKTHPALSDRQIARIVGCSHMTVHRERNPLRRALGTMGDALASDGQPIARSGPRSIEERAVTLFAHPKAEAPDVATLTSLFVSDRSARVAAARWAQAIAQAYQASEPATPASTRPSG